MDSCSVRGNEKQQRAASQKKATLAARCNNDVCDDCNDQVISDGLVITSKQHMSDTAHTNKHANCKETCAHVLQRAAREHARGL